MRFWGIGASGSEGNFDDQFINQDVAYINWSRDEAPTLYRMLEQISYGDLVYIKSYTIKGNIVTIKAIGIVTKTVNNGNFELKVRWFNQEHKKVSVVGDKNNVYSNTLYEEYKEEIINYLKEKLIEKL